MDATSTILLRCNDRFVLMTMQINRCVWDTMIRCESDYQVLKLDKSDKSLFYFSWVEKESPFH